MHSIDLNGNLCVNLNDFNDLSISIRKRDKINFICNKLERPDEISNFSITFIFKNGFRYYLSNLYLWAIPYITEGYCRGDRDHDLSSHKENDFFIQSKENYDEMQLSIVDVLENRYNLCTVFALIRNCSECVLVIEAYSNNLINGKSQFCYNTMRKFELFIADFLDEMHDDLMRELSRCSHYSIINDKLFRRDVITQSIKGINFHLTVREKECLSLFCNGLSIKTVASELCISPETVISHTKAIRRKLECSNITQAAVMAHSMGLLDI